MIFSLKKMVRRNWIALLLAAGTVVISGCCSSRPAEPLIPLPDSQMPTKADLSFKPWRVVVVSPQGNYQSLEQTFIAELKRQLARYGIRNISSDARSNAMITKMLRNQAQSGGEGACLPPPRDADGQLNLENLERAGDPYQECLACVGIPGVQIGLFLTLDRYTDSFDSDSNRDSCYCHTDPGNSYS